MKRAKDRDVGLPSVPTNVPATVPTTVPTTVRATEPDLKPGLKRGKRWALRFAVLWQCALIGTLGAVAQLPQRDFATGNPALKGREGTSRHAELCLGASGWRANEPLLYPLGTRYHHASLRASAFSPIGTDKAMWADAAYVRSQKHDVSWIAMADYMQLYPYVTADTAVGRMENEHYAFRAGYAVGNGRWTTGMTADIRAEHEYRTTDPRPRSIATDVVVRLGAACDDVWGTLAMSAGLHIYKQTSDVEYFREAGTIPEYHLTGLGSHYARFAGGASETIHQGTGFDFGTDVRTPFGLYLSVKYCLMPYRQMLTRLNATPLTTLYVHEARTAAGWHTQVGRVRLTPFLTADMERRRGEEEIAGNASATEFEIIGTLSMYSSVHTHSAAGVQLSVDHGTNRWEGELTVGADNFRSHYAEPSRTAQWDKQVATLRAAHSRVMTGGNMLRVALAAQGSLTTNRDMEQPWGKMEKHFAQMVTHHYQMATANSTQGTVSVRYDFALSNRNVKTIFALVEAEWVRNNNNHHMFGWDVGVGITF